MTEVLLRLPNHLLSYAAIDEVHQVADVDEPVLLELATRTAHLGNYDFDDHQDGPLIVLQ